MRKPYSDNTNGIGKLHRLLPGLHRLLPGLHRLLPGLDRRLPTCGRTTGRLWVSCAALLISACGADPDTAARITDPTAQVARSSHGMVSSASQLATEAGAGILAQGGNAIDAAVATKFAISVALPSMAGIGGRTQILLRTADGRFVGIDGGTQVPMNFHPDGPPGYRTAGIPGTVAALAMALEHYGTMTLAEVMEPAIRLAEEGFPMPEDEAEHHADLADRLQLYEGSRRYFLKPDGSSYQAGELWVQEDLGRTLRLIAQDGPDAFYRGPIAEMIEADMEEKGGFLTREELAGYEALEMPVFEGMYRGLNIYGTYRPARGTTCIQILQVMEHFDLPTLAGSPEWAAITGQAIRLAFADRNRDPHMVVSPELAAERAAEVQLPGSSQPAMATASGSSTGWIDSIGPYTTHLSVADSEGNVVAMTGSLGPALGSRVAAPGLGFLYAQTMHYSGRTLGSRPPTNQSPLILTHPDGTLVYVVGGAGGARIISAIILSLSRAIDQGMSLADAVSAPRFHPVSIQLFRLEDRDGARWTTDAAARLVDFGFEIDTDDTPAYFGRVHGIEFDVETGQFIGVADPRRSGSAAGPR